MPPAAKFTKQEIIDAGLRIVREQGFFSLTARALGSKLGASARPIFTVFKNMDEVRGDVKGAARNIYNEYVKRGLNETPAFKGVGKQYILFAITEPKLFRLLFMDENDKIPTLNEVLPAIDENYERILASVEEGYGVGRDTAEKLYRHLWIYSHGIATLCATKTCIFTGEEISAMMTEVFTALLDKFKTTVKE